MRECEAHWQRRWDERERSWKREREHLEWLADFKLENAKWHAEREREQLEWMANFERESAERRLKHAEWVANLERESAEWHREQEERAAEVAKARSKATTKILWAIFGSYTVVGVVFCIVAVLT